MKRNYTHMIIINLHEIEYLDDVLLALANECVKETTIMNADSIISRNENYYPSISNLLNLFKESKSQNYHISAIIEETRIESLSTKLRELKTKDRYVSSFWYIPIQNYMYHKTNIDECDNDI